MAFILENKETEEHPRIVFQATGVGGSGKSTLLCHLPWDSNPSWEGKGIYIAADPTSPEMHSVLQKDRDRWYVYIPDGNKKTNEKGNILTNWQEETFELCMKDWLKVHPDVKVICWDSFTTTAHQLLDENVKEQNFSEKGPTSGIKSKSDARFLDKKEQSEALGNMGDYRMVQNFCYNKLHWLIKLESHKDLHILVSFQPAIQSPNPLDGSGLRIGPDITGTKGPMRIPPLFDSNVYLERNKEGKVKMKLVPTGPEMVNIKSVRQKEIPKEITFGGDIEEVRNFWLTLQDWKRG